MGSRILVTGAAGYIGGSIIADFKASNNSALNRSVVTAAVRSEDQANTLSKLGISVLRLDLTNEDAVTDALLQHEFDIVINTASSLNPAIALNLIKGLAKVKEVIGRDTSIIHTSGMSAFFEATGWPAGQTSDDSHVFEKVEALQDSFPIRKVDYSVTEQAKELGVKSYILVPSLVYGKGSGQWNQLSVLLPVQIKSFLERKRVTKFGRSFTLGSVHIHDLTALYERLVVQIIEGAELPNGENGFYFGIAHRLNIGKFLDAVAKRMYERGLTITPKPDQWKDYADAAEGLGVPEKFVPILWDSWEDVEPRTREKASWQPKWDERQMMEKVDDEIDAVMELGAAKSSLIDSLWAAAKA